MAYVSASRPRGLRKGLGSLMDLAPNDPALQVTADDLANTQYGGSTGGLPFGPPAPGQSWAQYQAAAQPSFAQSLTTWVNQNSGNVMLGAGLLVGVMLLGKAAR